MNLISLEEERRVIPVGGGSYDGADNSSTTDATPQMTSNTTPSGIVTSSPPLSATYAPFHSFDNSSGLTYITEAGAGGVGWVMYQFAIAKLVNKYTIIGARAYPERAPKNWTFQGSNDGINFDILHTVTGETDWGNAEKRTFTFVINSENTYTHFKVDVTLNNGDTYLVLPEIEIIEQVV
jgi:hypothetical protein